jgi:hypothetical protein
MRGKHIIGVAILCIAGTYWVAKQSNDEPTRTATVAQSRDADVERMRRDLDLLRGEMSLARGQRASNAAAVSQRAEGNHTLDGAGESTPGDDFVEPRDGVEVAAAQLSSVEAVMHDEPVDAQWATWAEGEIADTLTGIGAADHTTSCRETLCKVELDFASAGDRDQVIQDLPSALPWDSEGFFHASEDGLEVAVYIAREGELLPSAVL